jgi:hypothetical protein
MVPDLNEDGLLPPGVYLATLKEIGERFGRANAVRKGLFRGLTRALQNLREAGVERVYIDGSFVTGKQLPNDVDGCWDAEGLIDLGNLDPVFLDFSDHRRQMKERYGVDFFPASSVEGESREAFLDFFQVDRDGRSKGILVIDL